MVTDTTSSPVESDFGDVLHAYALVESRSKPGNFYAIHLSGDVIAGKIEAIGNNNEPTHSAFATGRMITEIAQRRDRKAWGKP